jgi:hypothetical protein
MKFMRRRANTPDEKKAVGAASTNAIWTKTRLRDAGYLVEDVMCHLCGKVEDTLHHRMWWCDDPAVVEARTKAATPEVIAAARLAGPQSTLYQFGICAHPSDDMPRVCQPRVQWQIGNGPVHSSSDTPGEQPTLPTLTGSVFADGHCSRFGVQGMDRAAWGLVQVDHAGMPVAWVRGTVPPDYAQTPQAAEFFAAVHAVDLTDGNATLYDDCLNVVRQFQREVKHWGDESSAYAGAMRTAAKWKTDESFATIEKVKAHVDFQKLQGREWFLAKGNDLADHHAKEAGKWLHDRASKEISDDIRQRLKHAAQAVKVMAKVLTLWPYPTQGHVRAPKSDQCVPPPPVPTWKRHTWFRKQKGWSCHTCRAWSGKPNLCKSRVTQECPGLDDALATNSGANLGHAIAELQSPYGPFSICTDCGKYSSRVRRGLAHTCSGRIRTRRAAEAWNRVFRLGRHPYHNTRLRHVDGKDLGRADRLRGVIVREKVKKRLLGKTKPWTAALSGISAPQAAADAPSNPQADDNWMHDADEQRLRDEAEELLSRECESFDDFLDETVSEPVSQTLQGSAPQLPPPDDQSTHALTPGGSSGDNVLETSVPTPDEGTGRQESTSHNPPCDTDMRSANAQESSVEDTASDENKKQKYQIAQNRLSALRKKEKARHYQLVEARVPFKLPDGPSSKYLRDRIREAERAMPDPPEKPAERSDDQPAAAAVQPLSANP